MQKLVKIGIISGILVAAAIIIYFFFPHIWGDILYPLKYETYIVKYSKENNLKPSFVAAVIYTESRFNADSVSRVGAKGLMQIMPATGQGIAQRMGDSKMNDLFDPESNIRYGTFYLREKLDIYDNNIEAVLTAYNAGGAVADRYLIAREAVLPQETKGFIKTVKSAQEIYEKLYADRLTEENVAEQMKIKQKPTLLERIINFFNI